MSHGLNNRGMTQIAIGAALLAGAWYLGQRSSAASPDLLTAPTADLKAEDLVWNSGPVNGPNSSAELPTSSGATSPQETGGDQRPRPMIVEPDFSQAPIAPPLQSVSRPQFAEPGQSSRLDAPLAALLPSQPAIDPLTAQPHPPAPANPAGLNPPPAELTPLAARTGRSGREVDVGGFRVHVVRAGETLQSISTQHFGSPDYYLDIYAANQDLLSSPTASLNGLDLKIPVLGDQPDSGR